MIEDEKIEKWTEFNASFSDKIDGVKFNDKVDSEGGEVDLIFVFRNRCRNICHYNKKKIY